MGVRGGESAIYLISKISKRSNGSDVRTKAIPQMCPTLAETTFQKIGTGLRQSQSAITIPKSIVCSVSNMLLYEEKKKLIKPMNLLKKNPLESCNFNRFKKFQRF